MVEGAEAEAEADADSDINTLLQKSPMTDDIASEHQATLRYGPITIHPMVIKANDRHGRAQLPANMSREDICSYHAWSCDPCAKTPVSTRRNRTLPPADGHTSSTYAIPIVVTSRIMVSFAASTYLLFWKSLEYNGCMSRAWYLPVSITSSRNKTTLNVSRFDFLQEAKCNYLTNSI